MSDFNQTLPITEVKKDLLSLVKRIEKINESVTITRNGKPAAVLLSIDEYEGMLETLEILSDPKLLKSLRKSKKQFEEGKFVTHEEVWGK